MRMLEREKKMWGTDSVLFIASFVLCVVTGINFLKREDNENHRLEAIETKQSDQDERQKAILEKLDKLTAKPEPTPAVVNFNLEKPIEVTIVEKPKLIPPRPIIPDVPPQISGKKGQRMKMGVLIKRSGMPSGKDLK